MRTALKDTHRFCLRVIKKMRKQINILFLFLHKI